MVGKRGDTYISGPCSRGQLELTGRAALVALLAFVVIVSAAHRPPVRLGSAAAPASSAQVTYRHAPLSFIANHGQVDLRVRYYAEAGGVGYYFTDRKVVLSFAGRKQGVALDLAPLGASPDAKLEALHPLPGKVNYIGGAKSHTGIPTFGRVAYRNIWPGVDLVFRGKGKGLEYELRVEPGADVGAIRFAYRGAEGISVAARGDLLVKTPLGALHDAHPRSWQRAGGRNVRIPSHYVLGDGGNSFRFRVGRSYDPRRPLVIDPVLYSTFLGGSGLDKGLAIAADAAGNAYVTTQTDSSDFPTKAGSFDVTYNAGHDVSVTKLSAAGALVYSTFLGGGLDDVPAGIAVDSSGNAYVAGHTASPDFPTTAGAFDTTLGGTDDIFVTKLGGTGSNPIYSTLIGGSGVDIALGLALDANGNVYLNGPSNSTDFPVTAGAFDTSENGGYDSIVAKLSSTGSALVYSTYLGGTQEEEGTAIAVDGGGNAYVTGRTDGTGFPTTGGAFDTSTNGFLDAYVSKLNATGSALVYSTFLGGGSNDRGRGIAVDSSGNAYITTFESSSDFPTTAGAFDTSYGGNRDGTVTKLNASGSALTYSTYLGGSAEDKGGAVVVDATGSAYVTGPTASSDFPTTVGAPDTTFNGGLGDAYVTKLKPSGAGLASSTYVGGSGDEEGDGIAVDANGTTYVAGYTESSNFPVTAGAFDTTLGGTRDAFVQVTLNPTGFPRPKGATPIRASLAVAYKQCTAGNRTHGAPLSAPSCNPPIQASSFLTVGTGDANGATPNSVGSVRFDSKTTAPEDVSITTSITDVRNQSGLSDYLGQLQVNPSIRITDRNNSAAPGTDPYADAATASEVSFPVTVPCAATSDTSIGSSCSLATTANSVLAGAVGDGQRTIWELGQVQVFDGGSDGVAATSGNTLFMDEGIFIP
jgi:hypothetical protein